MFELKVYLLVLYNNLGIKSWKKMKQARNVTLANASFVEEDSDDDVEKEFSEMTLTKAISLINTDFVPKV